jgi:large subunit ribosomal protein L15
MITLKRTTKNKKSKLVGRGQGSGRGKTSGRGTKGQKARSGHKLRPEIRDTIKKYPKLRGRGKNINKAFRATPAVVNVGSLSVIGTKDSIVSPATLLAAGLIRRTKGVLPMVKILAAGELTVAVTVYDCSVTDAARLKIEAAGGSIK